MQRINCCNNTTRYGVVPQAENSAVQKISRPKNAINTPIRSTHKLTLKPSQSSLSYHFFPNSGGDEHDDFGKARGPTERLDTIEEEKNGEGVGSAGVIASPATAAASQKPLAARIERYRLSLGGAPPAEETFTKTGNTRSVSHGGEDEELGQEQKGVGAPATAAPHNTLAAMIERYRLSIGGTPTEEIVAETGNSKNVSHGDMDEEQGQEQNGGEEAARSIVWRALRTVDAVSFLTTVVLSAMGSGVIDTFLFIRYSFRLFSTFFLILL